MEINKIYQGNALEVLKTFPDNFVNMVITSPPYWSLRAYGTEPQIWGDNDCEHSWEEYIEKPKGGKGSKCANVGANKNDEANRRDKPTITNFCNKCGVWKGELGQEPDFNLYIQHLCMIFDEIKRVLREDGTCWVNLGDTYGGSGAGTWKNPPKKINSKEIYHLPYGASSSNKMKGKKYDKCLLQIPARFSIAMIERGWILRNEIIWKKNNQMPQSAKDKFTTDFEKIYLFSKNKKYYFNQIKEGVNQRNKRCVWSIPTKPFPDVHYAVFPDSLIEIPIQAGSPKGGIVLDPFMGSGTTAITCIRMDRNYLGIELNEYYIKMAENRIKEEKKKAEQFELFKKEI